MSVVTSLDLQKGQNLSLTKDNPSLTLVKFALGWDANTGNVTADLDASAILLNGTGKVVSPVNLLESTVYFRNLTLKGLSHSGDELTGASAGDDETISAQLASIPAEVERVAFVVNIYDAVKKGQNFGQVKNAFIRVYDGTTNVEMARYDLSEDYSAFTGVKMGELYRHEGGWKFKAIGEGVSGDLNDIVHTYC